MFNKFIVTVFFLFLPFGFLTYAQEVPTPAQTPTSTPTNPDQLPPQQVIDYYNKAKSSGMSDSDIERAAIQNGYTPAQISEIRKRLENSSNTNTSNDTDRDDLDETRDDELDEDESDPSDTTATSRASRRRLRSTFGSSFFARSSKTFEPNLRIATPKNYILGPEDELNVDIYGNSVEHFKLKISPEGTVKMLNLAPVYLNGLTIEQASDKIVSTLRQAYSTLNRPGSGTRASITLGNVRSIRVMITGEAYRPGTYTVSSLATAFNALSVSGGPNRNGSFRNIEVVRNNKVIKTIDLYRFLVDADLNDNIALQDQDIILIRPYLSRIELNGQVKRPGIFEAKPNEGLADIIRYAGGFTPEAYTTLLTYQRNNGTNYVIGSIDSTEIDTFQPKNGDIINVSRILDMISNQVEVRGAVMMPGFYPLEERSNTVGKLIERARGISPKAFLNRAILERPYGSLETGIISIDIRKLLNKEIEDIELVPGDILTIKSVDDLKESAFLTISGSVINPGSYHFFKGITIEDLIFTAGGFKEGGIPYRVEISRRVKADTLGLADNQNVRIFTLEVDENLALNPADKAFQLAPYDIVSIRKSPRYETQKTVTILGEVMYPGNYTIQSSFERIADIFPKAGGLKPGAYLKGAKFYRNNELVALDLKKIITKPEISANLLLYDGDTIYIPQKSEIVRIQGAVQNPSLVNFEPSFSYKDYLSQAGGYLDNAQKRNVYVSYPNGKTQRTKRFLFLKSYPKVEPGSTVTVPAKTVTAENKLSRSERIAIFSLIATMTIAVIRLF
ncbi:SLBB domain-containing protein [Dyadobacter tibetensis]|uniref:SLBB domain-containing protein n=1 Tax=Dyadobacter tibetensis TaxID=1211851 RepID=UPI0004700D21|nr:SLBB domain-containing protein [Dyadobacter tibetensis]